MTLFFCVKILNLLSDAMGSWKLFPRGKYLQKKIVFFYPPYTLGEIISTYFVFEILDFLFWFSALLHFPSFSPLNSFFSPYFNLKNINMIYENINMIFPPLPKKAVYMYICLLFKDTTYRHSSISSKTQKLIWKRVQQTIKRISRNTD